VEIIGTIRSARRRDYTGYAVWRRRRKSRKPAIQPIINQQLHLSLQCNPEMP
jgi:hypothetical protein